MEGEVFTLHMPLKTTLTLPQIYLRRGDLKYRQIYVLICNLD